mmetsp:Transcript_32229/g.49831  ORF Transcript_32229/g.49831 Transcript_32229/m.49831 type:complete len:434 (+) Transcript_32229:641-1942(+)
MATPATAGAAALVRQYFEEGFYGDGTKNSALPHEPTGALVKAVLLNGAQKIASGSMYGNSQGYGRVSLYHSLPIVEAQGNMGLFFVDAEQVEDGKTRTYEITLGSVAQCPDFRATLVWTDEPAGAGCKKCLVNDLDLTVTTGGRVAYPNGRQRADRRNNAERVVLPRDALVDGQTVRVGVRATNINRESFAYALVVVGCIDAAGTGPTASPVVVPPTDVPTGAAPVPTGVPTAAPVRPVPKCKDDKKFKSPPLGKGSNIKKRKCSYFAKLKDAKVRGQYCSEYKEIRQGCPKTCEACPGQCKNNENFVHDKYGSCNKIEQLFGNIAVAMASVCGNYLEDWGYVHTNCPVVCKSCRPADAEISNCCVADHYISGRKGCDNWKCKNLICTIDDICCKYQWDYVCVIHAEVECNKCKVKTSTQKGSLVRTILEPDK